MTNVSRIVALGGSICRILRGLEAPGGSRFRQPIGTGWVPLNKQTLWGRGPGSSRISKKHTIRSAGVILSQLAYAPSSWRAFFSKIVMIFVSVEVLRSSCAACALAFFSKIIIFNTDVRTCECSLFFCLHLCRLLTDVINHRLMKRGS